MAEDSPLVAGAENLYTKAMNAIGKIPTPGYKKSQGKNEADPEMVKEANASFIPKTVGKKATKKPVKQRTAPLSNKRTSRKKAT